jgi:hypothetical protein
MADAKKKPEEHAHSGGGDDTMLWVIVGVAVVLVAFLGSNQFIASSLSGPSVSSKFSAVYHTIFNPHLWYVIGVVSALCSIFLIGVIIFCVVRMFEIQNHEDEEINHEIALALARDAENEKNQNPRWQYVLGLVESHSESDWRVAIMEADSILDDIMHEKGYAGDSLGERLTSARASGGFANVENAWEGHTLRNRIAHDGANFPLSQMEARRAIRLYELCFEEFGIL